VSLKVSKIPIYKVPMTSEFLLGFIMFYISIQTSSSGYIIIYFRIKSLQFTSKSLQGISLSFIKIIRLSESPI